MSNTYRLQWDTVECPICKKMFKRSAEHMKYCSDTCSYNAIKLSQRNYYRRKHNKPEETNGIEKRYCKCGKEIESEDRRVKYCSDMCRIVGTSEINRRNQERIRMKLREA